LTEKARDTPTVKGRPSGTDTTISTTQRLICEVSLENKVAATPGAAVPSGNSLPFLMLQRVMIRVTVRAMKTRPAEYKA